MAHPDATSLQSKDHKTLMDIIDKLRSKGINRYVNLPQIVVCGDQSSGKSSVLQAISGMSFPTKDNLCTRFATELILRHTDENSEEKCEISITPGSDRSPEDSARLREFKHSEIPDQHNIGALVDEAKEVMGLGDRGRTFCKDILRIELSGPTQPHLTIVDLPGLFRAGNKEQSADDAVIVQSLVRSYMENPRSIILAVVSAQSNFALQEVTELAREIDYRHVRTLGLITKPDTLDVGSSSESEYFELAQNKDVKFRLGWHVVRNRDFKTKNYTNEERDQIEAEFLNQGIWAGLPRAQKGVAALRTRLSEVLKNQILGQLPDVIREIEQGLEDCSSKVEKLGTARHTLAEQRKYLLNISHQFSHLIKAAIDGVYSDKFFGNAREEEGYRRRLRAVIQNTLIDFSDDMRHHGQARRIVDTARRGDRQAISRTEYLKEVKDLMRRTRGCELPGTYNPLIVGELFHEQCQPWKYWLEEFTGRIFRASETAVSATLAHILDEDTRDKLWGELINDRLSQLNHQLQDKVAEILRPHENIHPITYNHYLTDNVKKARDGRYREAIAKGLAAADLNSRGNIFSMPLKECLEVIMEHTETDMELHAASEAVDWMEAYYKVALKQIIDDFSSIAIEACLISKLPDLFTPQIVFEFTDDTVKNVAAESWEKADERKFLLDKMETLTSGLAELQRLRKSHHHMRDTEADSSSPLFPSFERYRNRSESPQLNSTRSSQTSEHLHSHTNTSPRPEPEPEPAAEAVEELVSELEPAVAIAPQLALENELLDRSNRSKSGKKRKKKASNWYEEPEQQLAII